MPWCSNSVGVTAGGVGGVKWWRMLVLVVLLSVLLAIVADGTPVAAHARRGSGGSRNSGDNNRGRSNTEGDVQLRTRHEWKRRHRKSSECRLGKNRYSLNEEWSPNLGPPFGVWNCVKCQCIPIQKKRRIVAKVRCRNVKTECPKVSCRDAVIIPGACCKTCPSSQLMLPQDEPQDPPDELTGRDFAVLLNGRTSQTPMTTSRVATGRLSLRRGTLHFSFLLESDAPAPESIQFMSDTGDVLEILEAQPTPYEATNSRICGTWTRVPKEYKALLREEKIWVALFPPENSGEDMISGLVARYVGVDTEVFSSLLIPSPTANQPLSGGGTAIISVDRKTDSLHVSLVFNGVFGPGESHNATLAVELMPSKAAPHVTDTVVLSKISSDLNRVEYMTTLGDSSLRLLTRGHVAMKVWSHTAPELAIEGVVTPRATCNVFSAVLSVPEDQRTEGTAPVPIPPPPHGSGWALLTLSNDGNFDYQVFIEGVSVNSLKLETQHRRGHRIVEDLTPNYAANWANDTYTRPTYRDLDALLRGKIEVVVTSEDNRQVLKGMLNPVAVTEALRSPHPVLLSSPEVPMAATVWMAVDSACVTHYDVKVAGPPPSGAIEPFWNLILREDDTEWDPRLEMTIMDLETEVEGRELYAHSTRLTRLSLSRLSHGVTYLDLVLIPPNNDTRPQSLTGLVQGVNVPPRCLLDEDPNNVHETINLPDTSGVFCTQDGVCIKQHDGSENQAKSHKCKDADNNVFEDGTSWQSPANSCSMCMCTKGKIKCQDVICPKLQCEGATTLPGECCPACPRDNDLSASNQACELNEQRYRIGLVWYPFLVPKGFDKCVTCTCQLSSSGRPFVNCSRFSCPTLHCDDSMIEHSPDSCCPKCRPPPPEAASPTSDPDVINHPSLTEAEYRENILHRGGCLYRRTNLVENGKEWYPRITSFGVTCVTCRCKDGNVTCDNEHCPELPCQRVVQVDQECCPRCADTVSLTEIHPSIRRGHIPRNKKKNNRKKYPHHQDRRRNSG